MNLSQAQIDYITATTNSRGAIFRHPYVFDRTQLTGSNSEYLAIVVMRLSDGLIHGGSKKFQPPLAEPPDPTFTALVDDVLTAVERHL